MSDPKEPKKFVPGHSAALPQDEQRELDRARGEAAREAAQLAQDDATWSPSSTGEHPVTKRELGHTLNVKALQNSIAMIVLAVGASFGAYKFVVTDARAQADAGRQALEQKVDANQKSTDASITELRQEVKQMATKEEVNEVRQDLREFYRAWRDDRRSPRLETPLDGGH